MSDDGFLLIEDDDHLVMFDDVRRINEIPWRTERAQTDAGAIKDLTYSNYLDHFCVLSSLNFFTFDRHLCKLEKSEQIRPITGTDLCL
jgi:predicted LPLAT superfamily acyltransferase